MRVFTGTTENPQIWGYWTNDAKVENKPWWRKFRAWLHIPNNAFGIEWVMPGRTSFSARCTLSTEADENVMLSLSLPLLFSIYFSIERVPLVKRLPGVAREKGNYSSGERTVRISCHDGSIWWVLWRNDKEWKSGDWRQNNFSVANFILGKNEHTKIENGEAETFVEMPEGVYPATVKLFTSTWKRSRWPFTQIIKRAKITTDGIPVPGKGENSWDIDDDAIYSIITQANNIEEAKAALVKSAMRDRTKYRSADWVPSDGWPDYCNRVAR